MLRILALTTVIVFSNASLEARPLTLDDLSSLQQKKLWTMVDDYAGYAVIVNRCTSHVEFEAQMRKAVGACVDAGALRQVSSFYRNRLAAFEKTTRAGVCTDGYVVEHHLPQKLRSILSEAVAEAATLCALYLQTGIFPK